MVGFLQIIRKGDITLNQKNYRVIQIAFILALLLIGGGIVFWFLGTDHRWGSLLTYVALFVVTATNFVFLRNNRKGK